MGGEARRGVGEVPRRAGGRAGGWLWREQFGSEGRGGGWGRKAWEEMGRQETRERLEGGNGEWEINATSISLIKEC